MIWPLLNFIGINQATAYACGTINCPYFYTCDLGSCGMRNLLNSEKD